MKINKKIMNRDYVLYDNTDELAHNEDNMSVAADKILITSLGKTDYISHVLIMNCGVKSFGKSIKNISKLYIVNSKVKSLGNLEIVGKLTVDNRTTINDFGKLNVITDSVVFATTDGNILIDRENFEQYARFSPIDSIYKNFEIIFDPKINRDVFYRREKYNEINNKFFDNSDDRDF